MSLAACKPDDEVPLPITMPLPSSAPEQQALEWKAAKDTFDRRCVVCHGCYDAPCQLKLSSWDGIARGATHAKVYEPTRLREADPTRLGIDHTTLEAWRDVGFHPVLPENAVVDPAQALITRMLDLKRENPLLLDAQPLSKDFDIGIDREEQCPNEKEFGGYRKEHPGWGMPYALPGLADADHQSLVGWVAAGTPHQEPAALLPEVEQSIARWEAFFNAPGLKQQVVSRYIYEHLFLGSLYFQGLDEQTFFRIVRSRTPSGIAIDEIPTRRPFEDPGQPTFFYRLQRRDDTRLYKTQIPYPMSDAKLARYKELFLDPPYEITTLPGYRREVSSNPFRAFAELPVGSRYRFMLDDAQFIMAGFIKGPVCRGQVALNVIEDRFWISFIDPDSPLIAMEAKLLAESVDDLALPAEMGSNNLLVTWRRYARQEERFLKDKSDFLNGLFATGPMTRTQIWDGDGTNANAALTVMRHFDSATVIKGLVGGDPKTAWVLDYSLFERIHYLLVAGYDVFGNIGHQLQSRMYMDFLRMEGEFNFLTFLPISRRKALMESWYRDTDDEVKDHVYGAYARYDQETGLVFQTATPEHELYAMIRDWAAPVLEKKYELTEEPELALRDVLAPLAMLQGRQVSFLSETSFLEVTRPGGASYFTLLRDSAHTNVAHLFQEDDRRRPNEDQLTLLRGFVGAYPNTLYSVAESDLPAFVEAVRTLDSDQAYTNFRTRFGVRRTDARFWDLSDRIHKAFPALEPQESGLFDYNRLEAN